jgi:pSer/pThr/pTyr-binding forkhead associated (FHA) protein
LEIVKGEQSGSIIPIQGNFYIGRGSENQFRLSDTRISRQHVCFKYAQGAWFIQDQNSKDGTFVNGQKVPATRLNPGDQIRIGDTEFIFQV